MIELLSILCLLLAAERVLHGVNSRRERGTLMRAVELAIREGNEERRIHAQTVSELTAAQAVQVAELNAASAKTVREMATHIQQPDAAPFILSPEKIGKQHITMGDEEESEGWSVSDNGG